MTNRTRALLGVALVVSAGCETRNAFVPPPPPVVEVVKPAERPVVDYLEFTGTTRALRRVDLRARVNGYLRAIHFKDGADVKEGDLLFTIEREPFEAKVAISKAELQEAEARLALAQSELARQESLVRRNAATLQELDIRRAERDTAAAALEAARASLRDTELQLGFTEIRAPLSGRIGRHLVDVGNLVQTEQTLLATIEAVDPIYVYFTMSESDWLRLSRLRESGATLDGEGPELEMGLSDEQGFPHKGRLDFAELGIDPTTGTLLQRGVFENPNGALVPGLFARVRTAVGSPQPRLLVPEQAIGTDQRGEYLLVLGKEKKDAATGKVTHEVVQQLVRLGPEVGRERVVIEGLGPNDTVIVNGLQRARPGAQVEAKTASAKSQDEAPDEQPSSKQTALLRRD